MLVGNKTRLCADGGEIDTVGVERKIKRLGGVCRIRGKAEN